MDNLSLQDVRVLAKHSHHHLITHTDENGRTALHWAVINKRFDVADALLALGANPLVKDKFGKTPMGYTNPMVLSERDWRIRTSVVVQFWKKNTPRAQELQQSFALSLSHNQTIHALVRAQAIQMRMQ